ncbi:MAG: valine--tRNA ligase [Flavobacteriales bacterium]
MAIDTKFDPSGVEGKWYQYWLDKGFFKSVPDHRESFTIVMPPPNVTGQLHLGHTLNNTIQDILTRRARLQGKNACWVPGTDHASIATENKVIELLEKQGIKKKDLSREEFLKHAWDWTDKYGGIILSQLKRLGASCDWDRTAFTMDKNLYDSVIRVFVDLYNKGYIYRGVRMVNWDPMRQTALSDEEVNYKEVQSKLYFVKYPIEGSSEFITIATTRPETILGDTAICVNPTDERYAHLKGKKAIVPLVNRAIPIIFDEYVDKEFGTGALKVTPAHDENDYKLGIKHNLETIDILNPDGTLSEKAQFFVGQDRFHARKAIAKQMEEEGQLVKIEEIKNKVSVSERSGAVIEPKLSLQWFCKMKELAAPALDVVLKEQLQFFPKNAVNTYKHWMENINDWCISRQLYWGQQIPAFYYGNGVNDFVVAESAEQALEAAKKQTGKALSLSDLRQDEDTVDTWFSSWLWPTSVFNGIMEPGNKDIQYYYPTNVLVTGQDIIFFWVARMIMSGLEYEKDIPFKDVYFTGMVRDKQGRKMSKQLGNSPDLFEIFDKYSVDGVRVGVLFSSPAGGDLMFDEKQCEQGRNFANKIWNALRLVKGWEVEDVSRAESESVFSWFESKMAEHLEKINDAFDKYRISDALLETYRLIWDEFCAWYLEMVKPEFGQPVAKNIYEKTLQYFEQLMVILHPFMPFITEELWQNLRDRKDGESIMIAEWPKFASADKSALLKGDLAKEVISGVRNVRNQNNISPKEKLDVKIVTSDKANYTAFETVVGKMANLSSLEYVKEKITGAKSFIVQRDEVFIPIAVDAAEELERMKKELDYNKGFLISVEKKLANERFVQNAKPEVIDAERKKKADAEAKIKMLEEGLAAMK